MGTQTKDLLVSQAVGGGLYLVVFAVVFVVHLLLDLIKKANTLRPNGFVKVQEGVATRESE